MRIAAFLGSPRPNGNADLPATPVYWYGPTAIMKGFICRLLVDAAGPKGIVREMAGVLDMARQIGCRLAEGSGP
jgi:hypothetical protein